MKSFLRALRWNVPVVFLATLAACSSKAPPRAQPGAECKASRDCDDGETCIQGECVSDEGDGGTMPDMDSGAAHGRLVSVQIEPQNPVVVADANTRPTVQFKLIGTYQDDYEAELENAVFDIENPFLGDLGLRSGAFKPTGVLGGETKVTGSVATSSGRLASETSLEVRIETVITGDGVPADVATRFASPVENAPLSANVLYPLDGVVMPQNVFPVDVQWERGTINDLFRVTLAKSHVSIVAYSLFVSGFTKHWQVDEDSWRGLAQTDPDEPIVLTVDRWVSATQTAVSGTPITMTLAKAAITGSVYYWNIRTTATQTCAIWLGPTCIWWVTGNADTGRIVRIDDGTGRPSDFMPNPAHGCAGCHSVSPSGRYMAADLGGGINVAGGMFDLTTDLTGNPPPSSIPLDSTYWWFSTWNPDETRLAVTRNERGAYDPSPRGALDFVNPMTGVQVPVTGVLPTNMTHPAWSPDGTQIAFVANAGSWGGENVSGDISLLEVLGTDMMGGTSVIHEGSALSGDTPGGNADSYPTWSPDSAHIVFAHGTGSRSDDKQAALYIMDRDGQNVVRLEKASPGTNNFQPNFSPFTGGGYYWVSFLSKRAYGNVEVGSRNYQQVWVAAIKVGADPEDDPSEVPYWLPGQVPNTRNISAFWAPRACRQDGESCSVGAECCGGECTKNGDDELVCTPPPPERCREYNETCSSNADCCDSAGISCINNVCSSLLL